MTLSHWFSVFLSESKKRTHVDPPLYYFIIMMEYLYSKAQFSFNPTKMMTLPVLVSNSGQNYLYVLI